MQKQPPTLLLFFLILAILAINVTASQLLQPQQFVGQLHTPSFDTPSVNLQVNGSAKYFSGDDLCGTAPTLSPNISGTIIVTTITYRCRLPDMVSVLFYLMKY